MARSVIGKGIVSLAKGASKLGGRIVKGLKSAGGVLKKGIKRIIKGGRNILNKWGWGSKPKTGVREFVPTANTAKVRDLLTKGGTLNPDGTPKLSTQLRTQLTKGAGMNKPTASIPSKPAQGYTQTGFSYLPPRQDAPLITSKAKNVRKYNKAVKKDVAKKLGKLD